MPRKQDPAKPYFDAFHEFSASQKAYHEAVMMMHSTIRAALEIAKNQPEVASHALESIRKSADAFERVAHGREG